MFDPGIPSHRNRCVSAHKYWNEQLRPFRMNRAELIQYYAGGSYGDFASGGVSMFGMRMKSEIIVNLLQMAARAFSTAHAFKSPRARASTWIPQYKGFAARLRTNLNRWIELNHYGREVEKAVLDAYFGIGCMKTYLGQSAYVGSYPTNDQYQPLSKRVSQDDLIYDGDTDDYRTSLFISDGYQLGLDEARSTDRFDSKLAKQLEPSLPHAAYNDRADQLNGVHPDESRLMPKVDLRDVYFPREKTICTWKVDPQFGGMEGPPLAKFKWDYNDNGPYRFLTVIDVPDNLLPTSPADAVENLFYLANVLLYKAAEMERAKKAVFAYPPGGEEDASRLLGAANLQAVKAANPELMKVISFPGSDQNLNSFAYGTIELFKQMAGNLDEQLGLTPTAKTATQSSQIIQQVGQQIADSRKKVHEFVGGGLDTVADIMWGDPYYTQEAYREVPGVDVAVDDSWYGPHALPRKGSRNHYDVGIIPYSMELKPPEATRQKLYERLQQYQPYIMAGMINCDFGRLVEMDAELDDTPELLEIFTAQGMPTPNSDQATQMPQSNQPKEYIRTSQSAGPSSGGLLAQLMTQGGNNNAPAMS